MNRSAAVTGRALGAAIGAAVMAVAIATLFAHAATRLLPHANLSLVFLTAVLIVASRTGLGPALLAAILSFLAFNFFFTSPQFTFSVDDDGDIATLLFFLLMATVTGRLAVGMRRAVGRSQASVENLAKLVEFGQQMLSANDETEVLCTLDGRLRAVCGGVVAILLPSPSGSLTAWQESEATVMPGAATAQAAWDATTVSRIRLDDWTFYRLATPRGPIGLAGMRDGSAVEGDLQALASSLCDQAALAIERLRLHRDLAQAKVVSETEQLRSALLSSVSHDLRTPLASIIGATSSLQDYDEAFCAADRQELLSTVLTEARRLDRYIQNLLDMTRLGQGKLALHRDWVDVGDLVASAVARVRVTGEVVPALEVRIAPDVPLLWAHGMLVEQALFNLLDNAVRLSPTDGTVSIEAQCSGDGVAIRVCDQGPGIPDDEREKIFDMFYTVRRGDRTGPQGTGLGLAICRGLVAAHGGQVTAGDGRGGQGTCMEVRLPLAMPEAGHTA